MLSLFYSSRFLEKYSLQLLHVFSLREFLCCSLFLFSEKKLCSLSRWMTTFIVILSLYLLFIFLLYPLLDHGVICASFSLPPPQFHTPPLPLLLLLQESVYKCKSQGKICVLDIDSQGVRSLKKSSNLSPVYVFVKPPSMDALEDRLRSRKTETEESLAKRLHAAREVGGGGDD